MISTWDILNAVKSAIEADATVAAWANAVLISDVGDYEEPDPDIRMPYVVVKDGMMEVAQRDTCANTIRATVRVWVVVESAEDDASRGVEEALEKRAELAAVLDDGTLGLAASMLGNWHWVIQPASDKPFIDPNTGDRLPFHRAEIVIQGLLTEARS